MPVNPQQVPAGVRAAFLAGLEDALWDDAVLLAKLRHGVNKIEGVPLFTAGLNAIGSAFQNPKPDGWRLFLSTGGETVAADVDTNGAQPRMRGLSRGGKLGAVYAAFKAIRSDPRLASGSYEMRLVRIAGVLLEACWFKADGVGVDWVYPVVSGTKTIPPAELRLVSDVMSVLPGLATRFRAFDG